MRQKLQYKAAEIKYSRRQDQEEKKFLETEIPNVMLEERISCVEDHLSDSGCQLSEEMKQRVLDRIQPYKAERERRVKLNIFIPE
jgi:hypothetical protein